MTPELIFVGVIALTGVALHFLPRKASDPAALQKAEKVDDEVWTWIAEHLKGHAAPNAPAVPSAPSTHVFNFGGAPTDLHAADGSVLTPVTPAALFAAFQAACAAAALPGGTYTNAFGSWNQMEWLRRMDAKTFANWCAEALKVPGIGGGTSGYGWLTGLSVDGAGFFISLGAQTPPVVVPNTDPRA